MRRSHIGIIIILILFAAFLFYFTRPPTTIAPENTKGAATSTNGEVIFTYSTKTTSEEASDKSYSLKSSYPVFALKDATAEKNLNNSVAALVQNEITSSRANFQQTNNPGGKYGESTFTLTFSITANKQLKDILPIKFEENFYTAGAAHPGDNFLTANYDLTNGNQITLDSLFAPGSQYLERLSKLSIAALKKQLGSDADQSQIQLGAGPNADNFQSFLITDDGLVIIFNEYQVAAYAAGEQEITIPYSSLSDILAKPL